MDTFSQIPSAPVDPIFGLNAAFLNDSRPNKVNLVIGAYKTEELKPLVLESVRNAEKIILEQNLYKEYLPIDGDQDFIKLTKELVFGCYYENVYGAQALGGTGGLRIGGKLLKKYISSIVYIPNPTWGNHRLLFSQLDFTVHDYPYYDAEKKALDEEGLLKAVSAMPENSVIVLHAACHNPTGIDPTKDQWHALFQEIKKRNLIPFFDMAYQGFGSSLIEDAYPLRYFYEKGMHFLVSSSYSKNFGLYAERIGNLFIVTPHQEQVGSQVRRIIRSEYSNPPCHGARIVKTILKDEGLRQLWISELEHMRRRVSSMRKRLVNELNFSFLEKQNGIFSYTGLSEHQVDRLREEYAIYMTKDGRINVAGLNDNNLHYVTNAIKSLISH